jgi:hypothetical protein
MKIKDLPQPYKEMLEGNFGWRKSNCGADFWNDVYNGNTPK